MMARRISGYAPQLKPGRKPGTPAKSARAGYPAGQAAAGTPSVRGLNQAIQPQAPSPPGTKPAAKLFSKKSNRDLANRPRAT